MKRCHHLTHQYLTHIQKVTEEKCGSTQQDPALRALPAVVLTELLQTCIDCKRTLASFEQV
jgi:hypothetical protein